MTEDVLSRTVELVLGSSLVQGQVEFLWHAGEPLTAGLEFYDRALTYIDTYNSRGIEVFNTIQTNATLVNDRWASFLKRYRFAVGVSVDGPAFLHDGQRVSWSGRGTHAAVMKGVDTLRRHGIRPGVICVLTRESLAHPQELFNFFLEHGFGSLGFNVEEIEKVHTRSSLDTATVSNEYRHFMEQLFDLWWPRRADMVIREFDDFGQIFASCASDASWSRPVLDTEPFGIITVQRDGDISTFSPELAGAISAEFGSFVIGNVKDIDALADLQQTAHYQRIEREARESVAMCRSSCGFFPICGGEFLSNKFSEHGTLRSTVTMTCRLHRQVLATTLLDKLSSVSVERNESNVPPG